MSRVLKLNVKLKEGSEGPALQELVYLQPTPESVQAVTAHLQSFGFPQGNVLANAISFIVTPLGATVCCMFYNYVGVTLKEDGPHIVQISADCVEQFYDFVEDAGKSVEQTLRHLLNTYPDVRRISSDSLAFVVENDSPQEAWVIREVAKTLGKKAEILKDSTTVYIELSSDTGVEVPAGALLSVHASGKICASFSKDSYYEYALVPVFNRKKPNIVTHAIVYDGTAACRADIMEAMRRPRFGVKFLVENDTHVINIIGQHHTINVGDYIVVSSIETPDLKVRVMDAAAFNASYSTAIEELKMGKQKKDKKDKKQQNKTLHNSTVSGARDNVSDLKVFGDGDTFKLICKASSESEGWMKSTKAMEIPGVGCVVQVTTQQGKRVAEALTFVPNCRIDLIDGDKKNGRRLVQLNAPRDMFPQFGDEPVQDSLPAKSVAEIVDGINDRHSKSSLAAHVNGFAQQGVLFERTQEHVICARQIAHYHNMIRFDGSPECADIIIEWVNNNTDLSRVEYDEGRAPGAIAMDWCNAYPATPINVGDYVVDKGNGRFHVLGGKGIEGEYSFDRSNGINSDEVAEVATMVDDGPMYFVNKDGETVTVYVYDGTPASAGVIVAAAVRAKLEHDTVTYGCEGLGVVSDCPASLDYFVEDDHVVVFDAHRVRVGNRAWLARNFSPIAS